MTLAFAVAACGGGGGSPDDGGDGGAVDGGTADAFTGDPLDGVGAVEPVMGGFMFVEGPQWRDGDADLLFSDIPASTIYRLGPGGAVTVFRQPSDMSNGLALDPQGRLLAAEHGARRLSRTENGAVSAVAERFEGARLNSPNDVVVRDDGTIYFTDPPYGISDADRELDFIGVFRVAPDGTVTAERRGALTERPNGVVLAPDQAVLYVDDSDAAVVRAFDVMPDGALGAARTFATTAATPDGMAIDAAGNLFVSTSAGIEVFAPDGTRWGAIAIPEQPANCAFGDADHRTLYVTAQTGLYRVRLAHPGLPRR
ncbi:MAG: SMP-30/gluconolactonase/LRE family protein [Kofleriaceae bacterium]|nr:SMP-30/gluconolactonase/LRE family protein [Kofleriaceae bacterium]